MRYAIIESGGKQYKAVEGQTIEVDRLDLEPGKKVELEDVLLVSNGEKSVVGAPNISGAKVTATVVEEFKAPKIIVFKYKARKRYRVKSGHRQLYTRLMIDSIVAKDVPETKAKAEAAVEEKPKAAKPKAQKPTAKAETSKAKEKAAKAEKPKAKPAAAKKEKAAKAPSTRKHLSSFDFNARTLGALEDAGLTTVAAALNKLEEGDEAVLDINGIGPAGLKEIKDVLKKEGYKLP